MQFVKNTMTEKEAIAIIEDGRALHSALLHAARFILGVMRDRERVYARMESINHEAIKILEATRITKAPASREKMTMAEREALVCDSCAYASSYSCAKCAEDSK